MANDQGMREFPNVSQKLAAPKKLSAYEKEKQIAEAKRQRAQIEDAEALKAFKEAFADSDDDDEDDMLGAQRGCDGRSGPRSGPGGLGQGPIPQPPKRKRALDEAREADQARRDPYSRNPNMNAVPRRHAGPPDRRDADQEPEVPRSSLQLSNLPPAIAAREVEQLLEDHVKIYSLQMLPAINEDPRSCRAIVILDHETTNADIETALSALRGRYLGFGYDLSISRHLSSAALYPESSSHGNNTVQQPYGAENPPERPSSLRNAPPPADYRFAPPNTYDSRKYDDDAESAPQAMVNVRPPKDISMVRAIHSLADRLLSQADPERALEIEALLMAQPIVQKDSRFSFLFDARSQAGQYYRYLLWSDKSDKPSRHGRPIDAGYHVNWTSPETETPFPDLRSLAEVIHHADYASSDDESDDDDGIQRFNEGPEADNKFANRDKQHLRPLAQARMVHLLSRMPRSNARLRYGDIARASNFAIRHASHAAEEIVDILLLNIVKPFSWCSAAKADDSSGDETVGHGHDPPTPDSDNALKNTRREDDPSTAKLIALYIVSDVLSASGTAGARNAWKYRQLFETGFKEQRIFYRLGRLDKDLQWGKIKAEQWKRKIGNLLDMWEHSNVFSADVQKELKRSFYQPELTWRERAAQQTAERALRPAKKQVVEAKVKPIFRQIGSSDVVEPVIPPITNDAAIEDVDGQPMDDIDGEPMDDIDGQPMDDIDGAPMEGDTASKSPARDQEPDRAAEAVNGAQTESKIEAVKEPASTEQAMPKRRMRAEDMFADSDEE